MTTSSCRALGVTAFLAQPSEESQVEQLRSRISNIRFKEFVLGSILLCLSIIFIYLYLFIFLLFAEVLNYLILLFDE